VAAHPVVDVVEVQRVTRHPRRERHVASRAGEVGADEAGAVPAHPEPRRLAGEGGASVSMLATVTPTVSNSIDFACSATGREMSPVSVVARKRQRRSVSLVGSLSEVMKPTATRL
jgi:hypothetical protein